MPRQKSLQTNFSAGELSPEVAMRQDTDQYKNGAKSLLNRRVLIGGGTTRRPGSWWEATLTGPGIAAEFVVNQVTQYIIVFNDGRMDAYSRNVSTGALTAAGSITGAPWTGNIYREMDWVQRGNTLFLTHPSMPVQKIDRTSAITWARTVFAFSTGPAGRLEQPYLKIVAPGITLQPSGLTGSITLTASDSIFSPSHVGQYIRYFGKSMLITGFTDAQHVSAGVVEQLPATLDLTVAVNNFAIGEIVTGGTSGAKGLVVAVPGSTVRVVISEGLTQFTSPEAITGPNSKSQISGVANATPAAVAEWDQQIFGPVYGYPSCVELHRNRLIFGGHPAAPDYMMGSTLGDIYSFNVGTGADGDAIMESLGDAGASKIIQFHSAEQLLILTDRGPYYCPEGQASPFRPSSIAFFPFGSPWPINATAQVQSFDGGAIMVSGSLIIKARPTGNQAAQWDADEVSLLSPHLIATPSRIAVTSNFGGKPERYAAFRNADGSLAMLQLVEAQKIRNFVPWTTKGQYLSVASVGGDLYASVQRTINGATVYILERFDQTITTDATTTYANVAALSGVPSRYGSETVAVVTQNYYLGDYPAAIPGALTGPFRVGFNYDSVIEILPPIIDGPEGAQAGDFMRIVEAYVHVISSARFAANGYSLSAYQVTDDVSQPPALKDGPQRFQFMGWEREPTISISQPEPLPLEVLAIRTTVAY